MFIRKSVVSLVNDLSLKCTPSLLLHILYFLQFLRQISPLEQKISLLDPLTDPFSHIFTKEC